MRRLILRGISIIIIILGLFSLSNNYILKNILNINKESNKKQPTKVQAIIEYASIMGLFICGTYYALEITTRKNKK